VIGRTLLLTVPLVAGLAGLAFEPAPAVAASASIQPDHACTPTSGVSVVVDFGPYGGAAVECAPGDPPTGLEALADAGFTWEGTRQFGSFVCRIDGLPTPDDDQCVRTPPADAYWSYWRSELGGRWTYAPIGADVTDPKPGEVDGWAFGDGGPPSVAPPALPESPPPASPPATSHPEPAPTTLDPSPPADGPAPATEKPTSAVAPASIIPSQSVTTVHPTTAIAQSTPAGVDASSPVAAASTEPAGGGSAVGSAVGLGAIGLLAGLAAVVVLRRRRTGSAT
jgi:hypothetical protein